MSASVLLQPPVGRMPMAARWYLAGISMLALILVAVHFALQVTAQQRVSSFATAWAAKSGASIGSVRLRMLRGAVTIQGLHWQGRGMSVSLPFVLLRGHFTTPGYTSRITEVLFHDADIRLGAALHVDKSAWPAWLAPMLATVRKVDGDGELHLAAREGGLPHRPVHFRHLQYALRGLGTQRTWRAEASVFDGQVSLQGDRHGTQWRFDDLDAVAAEQLFGLTAVPGRLTGTWQQQADMQRGELEMQLPDDGDRARLAWHGRYRNKHWNLDVHSRRWPLAMMALLAPRPGGRRLVAGALDAALHLRVGREGWHVRVPDGEISGLTFTETEPADRQTGLYMRSLHLADAVLDWPQRRLHAARMVVQDASLAVGDGGGAPLPAWRLVCDDIAIEGLRPGIRAGDAMFWLPDVSGQASFSDKGRLAFTLATAAEQDGEERWHLQGEGTLWPEARWQGRMQFAGEGVPFVRLRPLLDGRLADSREMEGRFNWQGEWRLGAQAGEGMPWSFSAEIAGHDVAMQLDGRHWSAARLEASLVRAAPAVAPHFSRIIATDWACQAPLQPWRTVTTAAEPVSSQPFWLGAWQVDVLALHHGSVSVGQADAHWLNNADVALAPVEPGKPIKVHLRGQLGEGVLKVAGDWFPWGEEPHFGGRATLRHALPFVLRDWLRLSGLPRLIRGRISADLRVKDTPLHYTGRLDMTLAHAALEGGAFADDPLPPRIGYRTSDLFERLRAANKATLRVPFSGRWNERPLDGDVLADALLQVLKHRAEAASPQAAPQPDSLILSHIRLHQESDLRHNERVRLRQVIAYMKQHRHAVVELVPQLGSLSLDDGLVARVRGTQRDIEVFMVARGIGHERILPVWPTELHRRGEAVGIRIQAVM